MPNIYADGPYYEACSDMISEVLVVTKEKTLLSDMSGLSNKYMACNKESELSHNTTWCIKHTSKMLKGGRSSSFVGASTR